MKHLFYIICSITLVSCHTITSDFAQEVVDNAIQQSGAYKIENSQLKFLFRGKDYTATRSHGHYTLERKFIDSLDVIEDKLTNSKFERFVNGTKTIVADSMVSKYSNSVNSVHYFSVLPFGLNDAAVKKSYLGVVSINDETYHKVKVTFNKDGGGDDFDDVFIYWFKTSDYNLDYMAYQYHVNGGGIRFREAFNRREVEGIEFLDYNNYKADIEMHKLEELDELFEKKALKLLSKIELKHIKVSL